jgi:hypothetical protein
MRFFKTSLLTTATDMAGRSITLCQDIRCVPGTLAKVYSRATCFALLCSHLTDWQTPEGEILT